MLKTKSLVALSSRVHPGETGSSWMMKGVLDFLLSDTCEADALRRRFVFKLVPMINPDGVVVGNHRCSLAATDLNRVWTTASRKLHPTIYHQKNMMRTFAAERELALFVDLHGHSRKQDVFMYGCDGGSDGGGGWRGCGVTGGPLPGSVGIFPGVPAGLQQRILPRILHHTASDLFAYESCTFRVQRGKEATARVVCWRELGICNRCLCCCWWVQLRWSMWTFLRVCKCW